MNTNKWISTDVQLPVVKQGKYSHDGKSEPVLVCTEHLDVLVAYLTQDSDDETFTWRSNCSEGWWLIGVTHWMFLPDLPK